MNECINCGVKVRNNDSFCSQQCWKDHEICLQYPNHDPEKLGPWNEDEYEGEL